MQTKQRLFYLALLFGFLLSDRTTTAQDPVVAEAIQDTYIRHARPDTVYGLEPRMLSGNETIENNWRTDALIQFDLPPVPAGQTAEGAQLELFNPQLEWANRGSAEFGVTAIMFEWSEEDDNWDTLDADFADYGDTVYDTAFFEGVDPPHDTREDLFPDEWVTWDVTELVQEWYAGTIENNGLAINGMLNFGDDSGAVIFPQFYTKDYFDDEELHPRLVITFGESDPLTPLDDGSLTDPTARADYVHNVLNTYFGDSNLDGEFNSGDLVIVFGAGHYEDNLVGNSGWADGDWNGDKEFSSGDLVVAFTDGGFEQGPRAAAAVPEPASVFFFIIGLLAIAVRRRVAG